MFDLTPKKSVCYSHGNPYLILSKEKNKHFQISIQTY